MEQRKKDLKDIDPPAHDRTAMVRIQYLTRVESLINVGCHFGPDDLPSTVWDELIAMALERAFVDRLVDEVRDRTRQTEQQLNQARQATGAPPPGGTIFRTTKPFR